MIVEAKILKGCLKGSRKSQEKLYKTVYQDLMRVALLYMHNHADAQDVLNRAMLKVFTNIETFKGDHKNFGGWIRRIVVNEALDQLRSRKSFNSVHTFQEEPDSDLIVDIEEDPAAILQLLDRLPTLAATVFTLYAIEGYSHKEIGEQLEITVSNSKWNLHHARKQLQQLIVEKELL